MRSDEKIYVLNGDWVGPNMNFNNKRAKGYNRNLTEEDWTAWHKFLHDYKPSISYLRSLLEYDGLAWNLKYSNYKTKFD